MPTGVWLYAYLALWAVLIGESILLAAVIRHVGLLHDYWVRNEVGAGLPIGALAPAIDGRDLFDRLISFEYGEAKKTVVYFFSFGCTPCHAALDNAPLLNTELVRTAIVISANPFKAKEFLASLSVEGSLKGIPVFADPERVLQRRFQAQATPYVAIVDEDGRLGATGNDASPAAIDAMLARATERRLARAGLIPMPDFPRQAESRATRPKVEVGG